MVAWGLQFLILKFWVLQVKIEQPTVFQLINIEVEVIFFYRSHNQPSNLKRIYILNLDILKGLQVHHL